MSVSISIQHPNQLNLAWVRQIIKRHNIHARVTDFAINSIDSGTTTRLRLTVQHDAAQLPHHWFVKLPSLAWRAKAITALPRLLAMEIRFYRELAPITPVPLAFCLAAQGSTLVLADVTEINARAGDVCDALDVNQAMDVIEQLAKLHAYFWHKTQCYTWLAGSVRRLEDLLGTALAIPLMHRGLRLAGDNVPANLHAPALYYARQRRRVMRFLHDAPQTIVHHDCHAGNLFWHNEQGVGFLDWQLLRSGEGIGDVAYFLATAVPPELRRQYELEFIARYAQTLAIYGISTDSKHLLSRYRAHLPYALEAMLVTLAVGGMMNESSNLELIRRTATAVSEQNAYVALSLL